jgi:hypothetical protein
MLVLEPSVADALPPRIIIELLAQLIIQALQVFLLHYHIQGSYSQRHYEWRMWAAEVMGRDRGRQTRSQ